MRLAFPVVGLLVMVDLTLALLGRINAHLQLNSMAFPAKILATLLILADRAVFHAVEVRSRPLVDPATSSPLVRRWRIRKSEQQ